MLLPGKALNANDAHAPASTAAAAAAARYWFRGSAGPGEDRGGGGVGLVELGEVTGAGDHLDLGLSGDALRELIGVRPRHDPVLLAPQQQRRCRDQRQPLFELGVAERPKDT